MYMYCITFYYRLYISVVKHNSLGKTVDDIIAERMGFETKILTRALCVLLGLHYIMSLA